MPSNRSYNFWPFSWFKSCKFIDFFLCLHIFTTYKRIWELKWLKFSQSTPKTSYCFGCSYEDGCVKISLVIFLMLSHLWKLFSKKITIVIFFRSLASFPHWQKSTAGMMACALFHQQNTRWVIKSNKSVLISFMICFIKYARFHFNF